MKVWIKYMTKIGFWKLAAMCNFGKLAHGISELWHYNWHILRSMQKQMNRIRKAQDWLRTDSSVLKKRWRLALLRGSHHPTDRSSEKTGRAETCQQQTHPHFNKGKQINMDPLLNIRRHWVCRWPWHSLPHSPAQAKNPPKTTSYLHVFPLQIGFKISKWKWKWWPWKSKTPH